MIVTLSVEEASKQLGLSKKVVRKLIRKGEIRASNVGTSCKPLYRIRQAALDKFLDDNDVIGMEG